jgi:polyferredoxin
MTFFKKAESQEEPGRRKPPLSSSSRWVLARKISQYLILTAFLLIFIRTARDGLPANVVNIFMRLDPLLMLASLLSSRTFLLASSLALLTVLFTLIFGRAWCGWICPLGTTLDVFSFDRRRRKRPSPPQSWRKIKFVLLFAILGCALLGNLTLLVLDPLTLLFRTLSTAILPVLNQIILAVETGLYQARIFPGAIGRFDTWIRPTWLPASPYFFKDGLLFAIIFITVIGLNLLAPRFWCRYLCPLGGLLGLLSRIALFRREAGEPCQGCTLCTSSCPTGTIDPKMNYASDPAECTMCMVCLETCPKSAIRFTPGFSLARGQEYDPNRRDTLLAIGGAMAAIGLLRTDRLSKREPDFLIRPPGSREVNNDVLDMTRCIRCSECLRVCPTNALQPAVGEAGLGGFGSPILILRIGYCDYSCNACGQVCPVEAIPPLSLEQKQQQVIGKAFIDENRCIAWSDHQECLVCEEMCPIPDKAIQLEETEGWAVDDTLVKVRLPHVLRDRCIGCGICEYKCPVNGEAAIRVFVPQTSVPF